MQRRGVGRFVRVLMTLAGTSVAARAQVVRGTVEAESTHVAVSSALVSLLDASGRRVARTLTDDAGRYALVAPRPGRYTVRAERIGHRAMSSAPFELAAGETLVRTLESPATAVLLPVVVVGRDR